jgi:hypothetical protein
MPGDDAELPGGGLIAGGRAEVAAIQRCVGLLRSMLVQA